MAMNLVPAIYKGFGTMSIEEKKEALRERYLRIMPPVQLVDCTGTDAGLWI